MTAWVTLQWGHGEFAVDDRSRRNLLYSRCFRTALRAVARSASLRILVPNSTAVQVGLGKGVPSRERGRCLRIVDWDRLSKSLWPIQVGLPISRLQVSRRPRERKSLCLDSPLQLQHEHPGCEDAPVFTDTDALRESARNRTCLRCEDAPVFTDTDALASPLQLQHEHPGCVTQTDQSGHPATELCGEHPRSASATVVVEFF